MAHSAKVEHNVEIQECEAQGPKVVEIQPTFLVERKVGNRKVGNRKAIRPSGSAVVYIDQKSTPLCSCLPDNIS